MRAGLNQQRAIAVGAKHTAPALEIPCHDLRVWMAKPIAIANRKDDCACAHCVDECGKRRCFAALVRRQQHVCTERSAVGSEERLLRATLDIARQQ